MRILFLLLLSFATFTSRAQLIINEFSQGQNGSKEYVELVVVGTRHCNDSTADIRGWVVDDNNGWYGAGPGQGIATGCMRFANDSNWAHVPYGSIILLYNSGDKNTSITQPDDPTDANQDHVYIVPSFSTMLEKNGTSPTSPSSTTYVYPTTGFAGGGNWDYIGLRNDGDAVLVASPSDLTQAYHSISYGDVSSGTATIHKATSGIGKVYYLNDAQCTNANSYIVGNAPGDESPGVPNSTANNTWIAAMLVQSTGVGDSNIYHCMPAGQSYVFNGHTLTTSGVYHDTIATSSGCDSFVHLHLQVVTLATFHDTLKGCNQISYNGHTYTQSATLADTVRTALGCDSMYRYLHILLNTIQPVQLQDTLSGCQAFVFKGTTYYNSQLVQDTIRTSGGCDSVYHHLYIVVLPRPVVSIQPSDMEICNGQSVTLTASSDQPPVQWVGYNTSPDLTVQPGITTTYKAVSINDLGCTDTAEVKITVQDFRMKLTATPTTVEVGESFVLQSSSNLSYHVKAWYPENIFNTSTSLTQTVTGNASQEYSVVGVSDLGCTDSTSIFVEVTPKYPDIFMPSAFSPNGDGKNDFFRPVFVGPYIIVEFSVFNRWGQRVYSAAGNAAATVGWDGTFGSKACETDTYFYMLVAESPKGKPINMKGDVILVR